MGINLLPCINGVRMWNCKTLIYTYLLSLKFNKINEVNKFVDRFFVKMLSLY
jgi:hypothetical protein